MGAPPAGGPGYGDLGGSDWDDASGRQHPVYLRMPYGEDSSRGQALLFTLLGFVGLLMMLPQFLWLFLVSIGVAVVNGLSFWIILFTGHYPKGWFEFMRKFLRYTERLNAYMQVRINGYPSFSLSHEDEQLDLIIPYPEKHSRLWLFFAGIAAFPVVFLNGIYGIWAGILTMLGPWAVLFSGAYPRGWFEFVRKQRQQNLRIRAFIFWLRNEYPPFGLDD